MSEFRSEVVDMQILVEERRRANASRGELLQLIAEEVLSPWEALTAVATSGDGALMRLRLEQLVTAQPGIGQTRARKVVEQVMHILDTTEAHIGPGRATLAYILDEQAQGKRLLAVLDAFISHGLIEDCDDLTVWRGFPFRPCPLDPQEGR